MDAICPTRINGCSTGCPPIHVRIIVLATRAQKKSCVNGRKMLLRCFEVCRSGMRRRIRMENSRASTPPNLLGIERRIA